MKCKWYQTPIQFEAKGNCENPVSRRDKSLRNIQPDMVCDSCDIKPVIGLPLLGIAIAVPFFLVLKFISPKD